MKVEGAGGLGRLLDAGTSTGKVFFGFLFYLQLSLTEACMMDRRQGLETRGLICDCKSTKYMLVSPLLNNNMTSWTVQGLQLSHELRGSLF